MAQASTTDTAVRRLDATVAKYDDFADAMSKNEPVILHNFSGLLPSYLHWQSDGQADIDYLLREFGSLTVPVVECSSAAYGEQRRTTMTLREYLEALDLGKNVPTCARGSGCDSDIGADAGSIPYLKDWHFQRAHREHLRESAAHVTAVEPPSFFADDWLNWWCDRNNGDDYRFVYVGPAGSWTPMHHDVLCRSGQELVMDVRAGMYDAAMFPRLEDAPRIELRQGPGEAIFVPSGWHHQVVNLGDGTSSGGLTISVNTNWFNAFNLRKVHSFLQGELLAVRGALDHLREDMDGQPGEWERQCELVMRTNSALNMTDFAGLVMSRAHFLLAPQGDECGRERLSAGEGSACTSGQCLNDGWRGETWRLLALGEIARVIRELLLPPCVRHILGEDSRSVDDTNGQQGCADPLPVSGSEGHSTPERLRATLLSVEGHIGFGRHL